MIKILKFLMLVIGLWMTACKSKSDKTSSPADSTAEVASAKAAPAPTMAQPAPATSPAPVVTVAHTLASASPASARASVASRKQRKRTKPAPQAFVADTYVPEHVDTVLKEIYDTILKPYRWSFMPTPTLIDSFTALFDKNNCAPGDPDHPLYKQYLNKAASLEASTREDLKKRLASPAFRYTANVRLLSQLGDTSRLNSCRFEPLQVYYLTYNVLTWNDSSPITQYFNLDTATVWYQLFDENTFLGIVGYRDNHSFSGRFSAGDSLSYASIIGLHHQPLGFYIDLTSPLYRYTNTFSVFGYVKEGHVVFDMASAGDYLRYNGVDPIPSKQYIKDVKTVLAEAWYLGKYGAPQVLTQYIKRGTASLNYAGARPAGH